MSRRGRSLRCGRSVGVGGKWDWRSNSGRDSI